MKKTAVAIVTLCLCACGGKSSNGSGSTGTGGGGGGGGGDGGPAATITIQVNLVGAGAGRVTSQPAGIVCPGACAMSVAPGTPVTLTATADAKSHFEGYGGGTCSGLACAFTADATTKPIFANFTPLAGSPVQHTLTVTLAGDTAGVAVQSQPPGIHCPGVCSASFVEGTKIDLTTSTGADAQRVLDVVWSGACTGSADCILTLTADAAATATFSNPCAGLVPALPPAQTGSVAGSGPGLTCFAADSDAAGNVYAQSGSVGGFHGTVFVSGVKVAGVGEAAPLPAGFAAVTGDVGPNHLTTVHPDGTLTPGTALPTGFTVSGPGSKSGGIVVVAECSDTTSTASAFTWALLRFDDAAQPAGSGTFANQECARPSVLVDDAGATFLAYQTANGVGSIPAGHLVARWADAAGAPLTDWFDVADAKAITAGFLARPLIGGGVAIRLGDTWSKSIPSGKALVNASPAFEAGKDLRIVEGGKAYVTIPTAGNTGTLDVLTPAGQSCGAVTEIKVNLADTQGLPEYYLGRDGTLIGLTGGAPHCTAQYYPHVLK